MKRAAAWTLLISATVFVVSDALAQSVNLGDPDAAGATMVQCWHPGDTHVGTAISMDYERAQSAREAESVLCALGMSDGPEVLTGLGTGQTQYRGRVLGGSYQMKTRIDWKFICKGKHLERWSRIMNVQDDFPPDPCALEQWRLVQVHDL